MDGSWYKLLSLLAEEQEIRANADVYNTQACPNDGEILLMDTDGKLKCRYDGYIAGESPFPY